MARSAENIQFSKQKSALTRAINSGDSAKIIATCTKTVKEWDELGSWPDAWSRWDRALADAYSMDRAAWINGERNERPESQNYELEELRNR